MPGHHLHFARYASHPHAASIAIHLFSGRRACMGWWLWRRYFIDERL